MYRASLETTVLCEECKHRVEKKFCQTVTCYTLYSNFPLFYCPMHKKPYEEEEIFDIDRRYKAMRYVTREGKVICDCKNELRDLPE